MTTKAHIASVALSAFTTPAVIASVETPNTNEKIIGLASAVLIQGLILGLTELRKYLSRRKRKEAEPAPLTPAK